MRIPLLNIYIFTGKSFQKKQLDIKENTRAVTNKLIAGLLHDNAVLNQAVEEILKGTK